LDLGRHVLAKGFAVAPAEYKEVADELIRVGVLPEQDGALLRKMAGYRNRPVHFYHSVGGSPAKVPEFSLNPPPLMEDPDRFHRSGVKKRLQGFPSPGGRG